MMSAPVPSLSSEFQVCPPGAFPNERGEGHKPEGNQMYRESRAAWSIRHSVDRCTSSRCSTACLQGLGPSCTFSLRPTATRWVVGTKGLGHAARARALLSADLFRQLHRLHANRASLAPGGLSMSEWSSAFSVRRLRCDAMVRSWRCSELLLILITVGPVTRAPPIHRYTESTANQSIRSSFEG